MLSDAFKLTLDKIFFKNAHYNSNVYPVPDYTDDQNMWELLNP